MEPMPSPFNAGRRLSALGEAFASQMLVKASSQVTLWVSGIAFARRRRDILFKWYRICPKPSSSASISSVGLAA